MVEYLPMPELELFVVEFLIRIIHGGIFTSARVGSIRDRINHHLKKRNKK